MIRKLRRHKQQNNLNYDDKKDDSVFATRVPLSDNTACAAFTSTPERAHQKSNITGQWHTCGKHTIIFFIIII
jgi:hypothetical protein